jgi:hypothetical protein
MELSFLEYGFPHTPLNNHYYMPAKVLTTTLTTSNKIYLARLVL